MSETITFEEAFRHVWLDDPCIIDGEQCIYCGGNWDTPGNHEPDCIWVKIRDHLFNGTIV
jgi:hypothetical protein